MCCVVYLFIVWVSSFLGILLGLLLTFSLICYRLSTLTDSILKAALFFIFLFEKAIKFFLKMSQQQQQSIQVSCLAEQAAVAADVEGRQMLGLIHVQAPALVSDERASRAPISVSAVIDRSGSMGGDKLKLVCDCVCV